MSAPLSIAEQLDQARSAAASCAAERTRLALDLAKAKVDSANQVQELIDLRAQRDRLIKSLPPQAQVAKWEKLEEEIANLHTLGFSGHLTCRPQDCEVVRRLKEILADNERLSAQNADLHSGVCAGYARLKANADRILSGKTQTELLGRIRDARDKLSEALTLAASLTETEAPKAPTGEA